ASDYWDRGVIRRYIAERVFHAVPVTRGGLRRDIESEDPMFAALRRGDSLILFPEGTRGDGAALQPFKAGVFHAAKIAGVDVVPVWLENPDRVMPKGSFLLVPILCKARFGEPLHVNDDEPKEQFLERLQQSVLNLRTI